ncbi:MAG TPA: hypothetical protein VFG04_08760 [Planctomycetaceae bacterium]|jgi:hypothetical protein|nr:hypothetical protein [Planctomycetaceae bacterium]
MDVFCPHCLQSVTLEGREPGDYSFDCPECAGEVLVTLPRNTSERPQVRPVRSKPADAAASERPKRPKSPPVPTQKNSRPPGESFGTFRQDLPSSNRRAPREPDPIDFPFQAGEEPVVETEQVESKAPRDEWDSPDFEVRKPLRGQIVTRRVAPKPRRRKSADEPDFGTYLKWMGAGAAVWLVLVVSGYFLPEAGWVAIVLGVLTLLTSRGMILRLARKEGPWIWLACLLVPLYSIFFVVSHFRQTINALLIAAFGYGYLISGVVVLTLPDLINGANAAIVAPDEDDPDEAGDHLALDALTLNLDGEETSIHVDSLTCFEIKPDNGAKAGPAAAQQGFEFSGPGVSLRGTFPVGFHGDWNSLFGKSVPIVAHTDRPKPGDSQIKLPGRGLVKVTGGKFAISVAGAAPKGKQQQKQIGGAIELDIAGPKNPETIQGVFIVRVKPEN